MNKDTIKGTVDDAIGHTKRKVGEWTGDTKIEVEGAVQQVKGKAEKAWGDVKDATHNAADTLKKDRHESPVYPSKQTKASDEPVPPGKVTYGGHTS